MTNRELVFLIFLFFLVVLSPGCSNSSSVEELSAEGKTLVAIDPPDISIDDWPWWRGFDRNGIARGDNYPTQFDAITNVRWSAEIPGDGSSSPIVIGNRVIVTAADTALKLQSVFCFDRNDGSLMWRTEINSGGFPKHLHSHSSHAATTAASDGERIFVTGHHHGSIWVDALDFHGKKLWCREVGKFSAQYGYSASPVVTKSFVVVSGDCKKNGGFLAALLRHSGEIWWRKSRSATDSHSSPIVATLDGKDQILLQGGRQIVSYDPMTGNELWSVEGTADLTCGTVAFNNKYVVASGGYPQQETVCIKVQGNGKVLWRTSATAYVPSVLVLNDRVVLVANDGRVVCWNVETGERIWRKRLPTGVYSSPTKAGKNIYLAGRNGSVHVFRADGDSYLSVAVNRFDGMIDATPAACGGQLFLRVDDPSAETTRLYCLE